MVKPGLLSGRRTGRPGSAPTSSGRHDRVESQHSGASSTTGVPPCPPRRSGRRAAAGGNAAKVPPLSVGPEFRKFRAPGRPRRAAPARPRGGLSHAPRVPRTGAWVDPTEMEVGAASGSTWGECDSVAEGSLERPNAARFLPGLLRRACDPFLPAPRHRDKGVDRARQHRCKPPVAIDRLDAQDATRARRRRDELWSTRSVLTGQSISPPLSALAFQRRRHPSRGGRGVRRRMRPKVASVATRFCRPSEHESKQEPI